MLYYVMLCCVVLCCVVLCYIILYYIILYYIIYRTEESHESFEPNSPQVTVTFRVFCQLRHIATVSLVQTAC